MYYNIRVLHLRRKYDAQKVLHLRGEDCIRQFYYLAGPNQIEHDTHSSLLVFYLTSEECMLEITCYATFRKVGPLESVKTILENDPNYLDTSV